jgi:hypothetical protein
MGLYRAQTYRVEDSVGYLVTRVRASIFAAVDRELAPWGISAAQGSILVYIGHGRGDRAAAIARDYDYDTGSMTRMVARLAAKRLLRRVADDSDRRVRGWSSPPPARSSPSRWPPWRSRCSTSTCAASRAPSSTS